MNILFLYGNQNAFEMIEWLKKEHNVICCSEENLEEIFVSQKIELILSYTYRYKLKNEYIKQVDGNAVNIHISYLPWNRGANPNQWSIIENTPKGVSIHYMTSKLDGGDVIAQELVSFEENDTLETSYNKLHCKAVDLMKKTMEVYPYWNEMRKQVQGIGSYHNIKDYEKYKNLLKDNYNIKISEFQKIIGEFDTKINEKTAHQ